MTTKITEGSKIELYTKFIDFQTKNEQDGFLQSLIELKPVAKKSLLMIRKLEERNQKGSHMFIGYRGLKVRSRFVKLPSKVFLVSAVTE